MACCPERLREHLLVEDLRDEAEVLDDGDLAVVADGDAGALLPAVLQGVETEEGEASDVVARREDAEDAAGVAGRAVGSCLRHAFQGVARPHARRECRRGTGPVKMTERRNDQIVGMS